MRNSFKSFRPNFYVPTTSFTGAEQPFLLRGENMWLKIGRFGTARAECFKGNLDLSETIASTAITGTITPSTTSKTVAGSGTSFLSELHLGQYLLFKQTASNLVRDIIVVESIESDTSFTACRIPLVTGSGNAYRLPVIQAIENDRATMLRGNAIRFPRGHYLTVGSGELKVNGSSLAGGGHTATRQPSFALFDATAGTYTSADVGLAKPKAPPTLTAISSGSRTSVDTTPIKIQHVGHGLLTGDQTWIAGDITNYNSNGRWVITKIDNDNYSLDTSTSTGAGNGTATVDPSQMRAGDYNIRVCAYNSKTLGFSNPTDVTTPITLTAAGQAIKVTFNTPMEDNQDGYIIFSSLWKDNSAEDVETRYQGAWYEIARITADDLKSNSFTTGREKGAFYKLAFADSEVEASIKLLSFDNYEPKTAEFVSMLNGIPVYMSCLGRGTTTTPGGTAPGAVAIPSKPRNPEAVLLDKAITTAEADTIIGCVNANGRLFTLCQNSLQTLILTSLDNEPVTFRSLWDGGFRNPYNVKFVKDYLYGFSTQGIVRSVAGGDESTVEFKFASDVNELVKDWNVGHVISGYDPKNRAVCFFYTPTEKRDGYFVTLCLPFLIDEQVWNPPMVIKATDRDMVVSGVATVGENLEFLAGGMKSNGTVQVDTFRFDGGDSETKDWYLAWNFSDDGLEHQQKMIKGLSLTARITNGLAEIHGIKTTGTFDLDALEDGHADASLGHSFTDATSLTRFRKVAKDWAGYNLWTMRMSGSCTDGLDVFDELAIEFGSNSSDN